MPEPSPSLHLVLVVHAHQPAGNFEHVFEECYQHSYNAFLSLLEKHPGIHIGLHYSGPLLLWIEKNHPEYFERLRQLVASGQVEILGGGFYEPILISIPEADRLEQPEEAGFLDRLDRLRGHVPGILGLLCPLPQGRQQVANPGHHRRPGALGHHTSLRS